MSIPHRQCIACRSRKPKQHLIRIVRSVSGRVYLDSAGKGQGRGCYVCPVAGCIARARKHDLVGRHLNAAVPAGLYQELAESIAELQARSQGTYLGLAVKAGKTILGTEAVRQAVKKGVVFLVIYDRRTASSSVQRLTAVCRAAGVPAVPFTDSRPLDIVVGKPNCKAAGISDRQLAASIISAGV